MSAEDWEAEKAFWERHKTTQCYDLEHDGGYLGSSSMVAQDPDKFPGEPGTYVLAEDYRRVVEALEKRIAELSKERDQVRLEITDLGLKLEGERKLRLHYESRCIKADRAERAAAERAWRAGVARLLSLVLARYDGDDVATVVAMLAIEASEQNPDTKKAGSDE